MYRFNQAQNYGIVIFRKKNHILNNYEIKADI